MAVLTGAQTAGPTAAQTAVLTAAQTGAQTAVLTVVPMVAQTAGPTAAQTGAQTAVLTRAQTAAQTVVPMAEPMAALTPDDQSAGGPQVTNPRPALSRCVPAGAEWFAAHHWGEQPLLSHTDGFADLFSIRAVDELVTARGLRTPFLRMARNGAVLPSGCFTSSGGVGAQVPDQADGAKIHAEMAQGATLVLQGLHRVWPALQDFTRQLQRDLGHPTQCNAYVTPPAARGFDAHYDTHDVFVLQVAGTKEWRLHEPVVDHPCADQPWEQHRSAVAARAAEEPHLSTRLSPGDSLYIPRGWLHCATTTQDTSIHLTIGVHVLTGADVLAAMVEQLLGSPEAAAGLRGNLPLGCATDSAVLLEACERVLKEAQAAMTDVASADVAATIMRRLGAAEAPEQVAPLAQLRTIDSVDSDTQVRLRVGLRPRIAVTADRVRLTAGGTYVEGPPRCADGLAALASGLVVTARSLPGVTAQMGLGIVREALRQGIVIPVDR